MVVDCTGRWHLDACDLLELSRGVFPALVHGEPLADQPDATRHQCCVSRDAGVPDSGASICSGGGIISSSRQCVVSASSSEHRSCSVVFRAQGSDVCLLLFVGLSQLVASTRLSSTPGQMEIIRLGSVDRRALLETHGHQFASHLCVH